MSKRNVYPTFDLDWANEQQINFLIDMLIENKIKATFFVTHYSEAVQKIIDKKELFEVGIHPNFLENSTHGKNFEVVINYFKDWIPSPIGVRTHGLYNTSNYFIEIMKKCSSIQYDASTYLPYADNVRPYRFEYEGRSIYKIIFNWEDDLEFAVKKPIWHMNSLLEKISGPIILNFHPVHIFYNNAAKADVLEAKTMDIDLTKRRANFSGALVMLNSLIACKENLNVGVLSECINFGK